MSVLKQIALLCPSSLVRGGETIPDGVHVFVYAYQGTRLKLWKKVRGVASGAFTLDGGIVSFPLHRWAGEWDSTEFLYRAANRVWRIFDAVGVHASGRELKIYGSKPHALPPPGIPEYELYAVVTEEVIEHPEFSVLALHTADGNIQEEVLKQGGRVIQATTLEEVIWFLVPREEAGKQEYVLQKQ